LEILMPIYAYRCTNCGFEKDVMQKVSEPKLTTCPKCATENFAKQLTAPGFQLKGTGWYATDFKGGGNAKAAVAKSDSGTTAQSTAESSTTSPEADSSSSAPSTAPAASASTPAAPSSAA
jgi:putative FmdB family regulatory protein